MSEALRIVCGSCRTENRPERRFCAECGAPLAPSCPACGARNEVGEKFCGACGAALQVTEKERPLRDVRSYTPKHLADKILQAKSALEGERKQVTVLFADVKGSMELAERARESGDPSLYLNALGTLAYTHLNLGQLRRALVTSDRALELLESAPRAIDAAAAAMVFVSRGTFLMVTGQLASAAEFFRRGEQLTPGFPRGLSFVAFCRGEVQLASSLAVRELDAAERSGNQFRVAMAHWTCGDAQNAAGAFADALRSFEQALATGVALNVEGYFHAGSALAQLGLGDHERARLAARQAVAVSRQRAHAIAECHAQLTLARVLAAVDGAAAATAIEEALHEAERLIAETGARVHEPSLHEERARLAGLRGDAAGRERALKEAHRLFTEMDATGHVERLAQEMGR